MKTDRAIQVCCLGVAAACVVSANLMTATIRSQRDLLGLNVRSPVKGVSEAGPGSRLVVTMGPFRGLAVSYLWHRADWMKRQGKLFEANQLSHLVTTLMPHFPQVWSFHAWNMAYNISVATHTPEERWDWVSKGISLLRDRAIAHNPSAAHLYRELGYMFFHKIGMFSDDMHWYFKQQLAQEWEGLLGELPVRGSAQELTEALQAIVDAPETIQQFLIKAPEAAGLVRQLTDMGYAMDETLLRNLERAISIRHSYYHRFQDLPPVGIHADPDGRLTELLAGHSASAAMGPLLAFLQKKVLCSSYQMQPALMLELTQRYGPIDWRHPAAHALYWSEMGTRVEQRLEKGKDIDRLNTNRQVLHCLQQLMRFGHVGLDPWTGRLDLQPDPRFVPAYEKEIEALRDRIESGAYGEVSMANFEVGHENFLIEAATLHYLYGDLSQAQQIFDRARRLYALKSRNVKSGRYRQPLAQLVTDYCRQNLETMTTTGQFLFAMLDRAFRGGLATGRLDVYDRHLSIARRVYHEYQKEQPQDPTATQDRLRIPPFGKIVEEHYLRYMRSSRDATDLLERSRVWANAPDGLNRRVFTRLRDDLDVQAVDVGIDPMLAFPPPSGLDLSPGMIPPGDQDPAMPAAAGSDDSSMPARIEQR